jgi:nucleoside-diphosphate-sugar epimerase
MRILILGGTGFIGSEVVRALQGHDLWIFHRRQTRTGHPGIHHLYGDRSELGVHRSTFQKLRPDVLLDMMPQNEADALQVVDCFAGVARRLVAISSGSVYRTFGVMIGTESDPVDNTPASEGSPLRRRLFPYRGPTPRAPDDPKRWLDDYDKIPAERVFLQQADLPCSIVRLPMVYGPGDSDNRLGGYLKRMLDRRPAILLHQTAARWRNSRAFVGNVGRAIALVVLGGSPSRVYNVTEPEDFEEGDWIRAIGRQMGWTGTIRTLPLEWSAMARPAIDELPLQTNFAQHLRLDSTRIRNELGYSERFPFDEALRRTIEHLSTAPLGEVNYEYEDQLLAALERGFQPRGRAAQ